MSIFIGPRYPWGPIYWFASLSLTIKVSETPFADLTDVTLADEHTNSSWWENLQLMQVALSCGQFFNSCKWCHLVAKFGTYASDAIWWPIFQLMQVLQVAPSCGNFSTHASGAIWWPNLELMQVEPPLVGEITQF